MGLRVHVGFGVERRRTLKVQSLRCVFCVCFVLLLFAQVFYAFRRDIAGHGLGLLASRNLASSHAVRAGVWKVIPLP